MSAFSTEQENYIQHEVKLRMNDERFTKIDMRLDETIKNMNDEFKSLRKENFNHFVATIGVLIALFGGVMLTKYTEINHNKIQNEITNKE